MNQAPHIILSREPILDRPAIFDPEEGAEVVFNGVVRAQESDRKLSGIEYTAFEPMAEKMLAELVAETRDSSELHQVFIQHRLGFVKVGEISITIRVRSKHSSCAFELCHLYLRKIKTSVPIWKHPILF